MVWPEDDRNEPQKKEVKDKETLPGDFISYNVKNACVMCGEPSEPICWDCLYVTIEQVLEKMAEQGKLEGIFQKALLKSGR